MQTLKGFQKRYLRGKGHGLKPAITIGQKGLGDSLFQALDTALTHHELIKVKFVDHKEKALKIQLCSEIEVRAGCHLAGMVGHTALFYRCHPDPAERKIALPMESSASK